MNDDPVVIEVDTLSHEGRGVATVEGKTIFIDGALAQERVTFRYLRKKKRYSEGQVEEVLRGSPDRIDPLCPHFGYCGGCQLQHMDPIAQLRFKQEMVLEQLKHFGQVQPQNIVSPMTGDTFGYRRKARLGVRFVHKKGKVLVGFREKQKHYIAELESCFVLDPRVGDRLAELGELISGLDGKEVIAQIEVAMGDNHVALVFRNLTPLHEADQKILIDFGLKHGFAIFLQSGGLETVTWIGGVDQNQKLHYRLEAFDCDIEFEPMDFTQVNAGINQQMVQRVVEWLDLKTTDRVLDLFCGLGNFTLPMARSCHSVVGVEGSQTLVDKAKHNAVLNKIDNTQFYVSNLHSDPLTGAWMDQDYDKALLDPPRTGALECVPYLLNSSIKRLVYVSCNPATFARDIGALVQGGFRLEHFGIMDMFPQTMHVESIGLLQR